MPTPELTETTAWHIPESRQPITADSARIAAVYRGVIFSAGSGWLTCGVALHRTAAMVTLRQ